MVIQYLLHSFTYFICIVHVLAVISNYKTLSNLVFTGSEQPYDSEVHSEYWFGPNCLTDRKDLIDVQLYTYDEIKGGHNFTFKEFEHQIIGFIKGDRFPDCVIIKSKSSVVDFSTYNTYYKFRFCLNRVVYLHSAKKHVVIYYEWFIPEGIQPGVDWEVAAFKAYNDTSNDKSF